MSEDEADEAAAPQAVRRKAPRGGDPHLHHGGGLKLSVLSSATALPKWSFSTANRFKHSTQTVGKLAVKSKSSPALAANASISTFADDVASPTMSIASSDGFQTSAFQSRELDATFALCASTKAPRLEGSCDRFLSPRQRKGEPPAKSYQPADTMGQTTAPSYNRAPRYSFGGGKTRVEEVDKKKEQAERKKNMTLKPADGPAEKKKVMQLSRGFGTQVRLRHRGGALDLPVSPGPAAYEVPRDSDPVPEWVPSSLIPWGHRTSERADMVLPTFTDVGPGDHIADHPFKASRASPTFGLHLRPAPRDHFPDPTSYDLPSTFTGPAFSVGPGQRSSNPIPDFPGPGRYSPESDSVYPHSFHATFGTVERRHVADDVDPDEPPGPGAHMVRQDPKPTDKPSVGMPQEARMKKTPGMGPVGFPGPGHYPLPTEQGRSAGVSFPLARSVEKLPGPSDYHPDDHLGRHSPPSYGSLNYTAPRKSPFGQESSGTEKSSEAMLRRCAMEVAKTAEERGFGAKKEAKIGFVTSGPSYSLGARRSMGSSYSGDCQTLYGGISSIG